jgi:hypothetical protein
MTCIHNNFDEDQSWGGCIHCSEQEKHRAYYERNHPPVYYEPPEPEFIPNQFHYHVKIKKNSIVSVGDHFTVINYSGAVISIPNKIIKLKGKKNKVFVHKNIFNNILTKNNLIPIS